jgi:hypothetical protein
MTRLVLLIITFSFLWGACGKKNQPAQQIKDHPVPSVPVSITLYPNDPLNFSLQGIGGWKYIAGGINGIIVYRKSQQEFIALERTSTYYPDNAAAKVKVQNDNFTCKDTISGSAWQIIDGTVINGPAEWALRPYATNYDGNALRITN